MYMTSVKLKFRASHKNENEGTIYYQVIHERIICQQKTNYKIFPMEWDKIKNEIKITSESRRSYLNSIKDSLRTDLDRFDAIINRYKKKNISFSTIDIINAFNYSIAEYTLFSFMQELINKFQISGKIRTSETYSATLNSFKKFNNNKDILLEEIDTVVISMYESYLQKKGLTRNSSSFYMRILRAVYNRAVERGLITNNFPFKYVYTGVDKTVKRAITINEIKKIKQLDLPINSSKDFARDMFLFSFYTRGMSFIDMAYLKKSDLSNGILSYRRRKTGHTLYIKWEKCMEEIVNKYYLPYSIYLLPIIINADKESRLQYKNSLRLVNTHLKSIGSLLNLNNNITMYTARHSWASIARNNNIPISVISAGMGHNSETITQIYLTSIDTNKINKANAMILKKLY